MLEKLNAVAEIFSGYAFNSKEMNSSNGIPLIKIKNVNNKRVSKVVDSYLNVDSYNKKYERYFLQNDDILVAMTGQGSVGRIGKMFNLDAPFLVNQRVGIIRAKKKLVNPEFLYFFLARDDIERIYFNLAMGAGQPNLSPKDIGGLDISVPSMDTQQKIAAILSAYDDLIGNNLQRIKLLEEMAQITYEEWFVRMKFPGHETAQWDKETGLPEGWVKKRLGDVVDLIKDTLLPSTLDPKTRYIGLEHMPRKSITLSEYGTAEDVDSLKISVKKGDVLFGKIRPYFHKVGIALDDCITSTDNIVLRARKQMQGIVLQTMFSDDFVSAAVQSSNGTKMPRANWDVLRNYPVIIPDETVLLQFSGYSDSIIASIASLVKQNALLREAREILLPRLMTGVIDVDQVEVPEALLARVA